ncbi:MAG: peptidyl-tRNA hydrolase Pth2 [Candidatus Thorarchaeota archaeon]
MSRGKIAVQVAHGAVSAAERVRLTDPGVLKEWLSEGQKKVVVKVKTADELLELRRMADLHRIPHVLIQDAGLTELEPGTMTVLGLGPARSEQIDQVTGQLKLL